MNISLKVLKISVLVILSGGLFACSSMTLQDTHFAQTRAKITAEELANITLSFGMYDALVEESVDIILTTYRSTLETSLKRGLYIDEENKLKKIIKSIYIELFPKKLWVNMFAEIYVEVYSFEEMKGLLQFYNTQTGQQFLKLDHMVTNRMQAATERVVNSKIDMWTKRLIEEVKKAFPSESTLDKNGNSTTGKFTDAIDICQKVQSTQNLSITCSFKKINGVPTLLLGMKNTDMLNKYWQALSEKIAIPFCNAANLSENDAVVLAFIQNTKKAKVYYCKTDTWSDWISYDDSL